MIEDKIMVKVKIEKEDRLIEITMVLENLLTENKTQMVKIEKEDHLIEIITVRDHLIIKEIVQIIKLINTLRKQAKLLLLKKKQETIVIMY